MSDVEWVGAVAAVSVLGLIALGLLGHAFSSRRKPAGSFALNRDGSFQTVCAVCAAATEVRPDALIRLSPAEKALVVRERPAAVGKDLVEFVCPYCDASHCFSADRHAMELVGVNLYQGQQFQVQCKECRTALDLPPWPPGAYDGRVDSAPGDLDRLGLVCPFCGATSCVSCCRTSTRNRTGDGSLLCPRCYRGPLDHFFHPESGHIARN